MAARARRRRGRPAGGRLVADRERVLDAAERVIARDGSAASLEAVAVEAGVTKPVVYARVGSRAALSDALAARLAERLIQAAEAEIGGTGLDRARLAAVFRVTLETIGAHRALFLYVTRGSSDDMSQRTLFLAGTSALPLAAVLADWRHRHGRDPAVALPWAYGVIGMLNLVALWWLEERGGPVEALADTLAELAWCGIRGDA